MFRRIAQEKKPRTIPRPLVKALKVTQDEYETEKDNKVISSVEGSRQEYVCVTPHPLLKTPPTFDNKRDYKGDTHDETPGSSKKYTNVFKKDDASLKRNLDKETKNANDDEYIDNQLIKFDNIKSQTQENLINKLLSKRFTIKLIDLILSNIVRYEMNITSDDFINKKTKQKINGINSIF